MSRHTKKAIVACFAFTGVGAFGWLTTNLGATESFLMLIYFGALMVNTFFSIQSLSAITPSNLVQALFDGALVCVYIGLAFSFGSVLLFSGVSASLFFLANAKYGHLKRLVAPPVLLQRKMIANTLGAILSLSVFAIAFFGFAQIAAWVLSSVFVIVSIYILAINPMYRFDDEIVTLERRLPFLR